MRRKIQFEGSTACNARCTFCPGYDMTRPRGEMSDELFRKIIRDGKAMRAGLFVPFLVGEPFLFPRLWDWLDYMLTERVRVHIYTNAERMDVDRLLTYGNVTCICCSINAATRKTYDAVVRGPEFERVQANVRELVSKARCQVYASMVVVEVNRHEVGIFREAWGPNAIFGEFKNWAGARHDPVEATGERYPCWTLMNTMNILWDGRVVPCCMDHDARLVLGDANEQTLTEIWHSSTWIRRRHRALDFDFEPCRECNHNTGPEP